MTTVSEVLDKVAAASGVPIGVIVGGNRTAGACWARWLAMYVVHKAFPWLSLFEVADIVGRRDHGTAMYGLRKAERLYGDDERFRELANELIGW